MARSSFAFSALVCPAARKPSGGAENREMVQRHCRYVNSGGERRDVMGILLSTHAARNAGRAGA